ncbi:predicted protein [Botrytis cinerea T4]|uniref:Uncharacterized protein n=1 Tax=Botryotinia fuckeliana (strain T4) TaxID=999810 RepID=G2YBL9_BOTF4|nr:predicted protein [Botrytis cinerea T4]
MNHIAKTKVYNHGMITTNHMVIATEEYGYMIVMLNHVHWQGYDGPRWTENAARSSSGLANSDLQNAKTIPLLWV